MFIKVIYKLKSIFHKTIVIASIVVLWLLFDILNIYVLNLLKINDFLYAIYLLAGFRLLSVILFGWIGVFGVFLGYLLSGFFLKGFDIQDAFFLGILSSVAPFIAYLFWKKLLKKNDDFLNVSFIELFYLIVLSSIINAIFRSTYLIGFDKNISSNILIATFAANLSGSIIFLFGLKAIISLFKGKLRAS